MADVAEPLTGFNRIAVIRSSDLETAGELSAPASSCAQCSLKPLALYASVKGEALAAMERLRRGSRSVRARRMIMRAGEPPQEVFSLLEGWAYRFMLLSDGRRQILAYYLPGNFITLEALHMPRLHFSVQALTDVQLCVFDVGQFKAFVAETAGLAQEAERMCVQRTILTDHLVMDLGRRTAQEKLARMLMEIYVRLARRNLVSNGSFTWPLRQEHIADTLGLTPVHVSRTLGALKREGLVDVNGQTVTIVDESRLLMQAGLPEDYVEKQALRKSVLKAPVAV